MTDIMPTVDERARAMLAEEYLQEAERHDSNGYIHSAEHQRIKARDIMAGKAEVHALTALTTAINQLDEARSHAEKLNDECLNVASKAQDLERELVEARAQALEEAARMAEQHIEHDGVAVVELATCFADARSKTARKIAAAIRALGKDVS